MSKDEFIFYTATEILEYFKRRELSPVEFMEATIDRCESINPKINAITDKFYEDALLQARKSEARYIKKGEALPLDGLPIAVKDLHPVKDILTRWGSFVYENNISDFTLPILERIFESGGIMHIRTTTPEFAHAGHCHSPIHGITRNPWNLEYSSCGSSGGSAASVVTGMAVMADGDDGGGSLRMPAAACGIFGYKPPFGRNPCGLLGTVFETIIHVGMMTRSVEDMILVQNIISGQHARDPFSLPRQRIVTNDRNDSNGLKIAVSYDLGFCEVEKEITEALSNISREIKADGGFVSEVKLGWQEDVLDAWIVHYTGLLSTLQGANYPRWQYRMDPFVRKLIDNGRDLSHQRVKATELVRTHMWQELQKVFNEYDILICPTLGVRGILANHRNDREDFTINDRTKDAFMGWTCTYPFNLLSPCPVASIPIGMNSLGLPIGMQIVGRPYEEDKLFELAKRVETLKPWEPYYE